MNTERLVALPLADRRCKDLNLYAVAGGLGKHLSPFVYVYFYLTASATLHRFSAVRESRYALVGIFHDKIQRRNVRRNGNAGIIRPDASVLARNLTIFGNMGQRCASPYHERTD